MSKKNRAKHSVPRRHGDRNVQTRYSGKHHEGCEACGGGMTLSEGVHEAGGFAFIPEVKVKIKELHIHMDDHMETYNFHSGSMATVMHGVDGDTEAETGFEEEAGYGEEE